jgi:hypothetical protein
MKKILLPLLSLVAASALYTASADTYTYSWTASKKVFDTANSTTTLEGISWTNNIACKDYDSTRGVKFGTNSVAPGTLTLTTSDLKDKTVTQVDLTYAGTGVNKVAVAVGGTDFTTTTTSLTTSGTATADITFTGSASGDVVITLACTSKKPMFLKAIKIAYADKETDPSTPTDPETPSTPVDLSADQLGWSAESANAILGVTPDLPTLTNTKNLDVTYSSSNEDVATIATDGAVTILAEGSTTISAAFAGNDSYNAKTVSYTLNVTQPAAPGEGSLWTKVTSVDQLADGDIITFAADTYTGTYSKTSVTIAPAVMSAKGTGLISCQKFADTLDDTVTTTDAPYELTLEVTDDGWYLKSTEGYLSGETAKKVTWSETGVVNTISIDNKAAATVKSTNTLKYNPNLQSTDASVAFNSNRFAYYASGQQDIYIYKKYVVKEDVVAAPTFSVASDINNANPNEFEDIILVDINAEDGATVYYTTDGSTPTTESAKFSETIELSETTTINAIAVNGEKSSDVATLTVTKVVVTPDKPVAVFVSDIDNATDNIFYASATLGVERSNDTKVTYYYTVNTTAPALKDGEMTGEVLPEDGITITESCNVRIVALRKNITSATTLVKITKYAVAAPTITVSGANGSKATPDATITITGSDEDDIYTYTLDGSEPANDDAQMYTDPIAIPDGATSLTIKAAAFNGVKVSGESKNAYSDVTTLTISIFQNESTDANKLFVYEPTDVNSLPVYDPNDQESKQYGYIITATDKNGVVHALGTENSNNGIKAEDANLAGGKIYLPSDYTVHKHAEFILTKGSADGKYYLWRQLADQDREYLYLSSSKGLTVGSLDDTTAAEFEIVTSISQSDDNTTDEIRTLAEASADAATAYLKFDDQYVVYNSTSDAFNAYSKNLTNSNYSALSFYTSDPEQGTTGVDTIAIDNNTDAANADAVYYNLQGIRVDNPSTGIYIRRQAGTATKVIVR